MDSVIELDTRRAWERQRGESAQAFAAFDAYRAIGVERSMQKVARQLGKSHALMNRWSRLWRWVERSEVWDAHLADAERDAQLAMARAEGERLAKERASLRDRERATGEALIARANEMLKWPLARTIQRDDDGRVVTIIEPTRWAIRDAARLAQVGDVLIRLSLDMETSVVKIDVEAEVRRLAKRHGWDEAETVETMRELARELGVA